MRMESIFSGGIKKHFKDFDYWISYSYIDTKRQFMNYPSKTNA